MDFDGPCPQGLIPRLGKAPPESSWESRWLRWPDFWLPKDRPLAKMVLTEAWERAQTDRVEVACGGGRGRTGTALACLAVLDGVPAERAVSYVRQYYDDHAVELPWQRLYAAHFSSGASKSQ